jgi:sortase A
MSKWMSKSRWLLWLGSALILGGVAVLAWYSWTLHERDAAQRLAKAWLNKTTRIPRPAQPRLTQPRPMRHGDVVGELEVPRLHLSVMVFEGDDSGILTHGAGHIPGTALLSTGGNIGIAAHRDTYFRPLRTIHPNDVLTLKTQSGTSRYAVTETKIVRPSDVSVLASTPGRDLTLVTCYPFYFIGSAPERFIVHARKVG